MRPLLVLLALLCLAANGKAEGASPEELRERSIEAQWTEDRLFVLGGQEKRNNQKRSLKVYISKDGRIFDHSHRQTDSRGDLQRTGEQVFFLGEEQHIGRELIVWRASDGKLVREQKLPSFSRVYEIALRGDTCSMSLRLVGKGGPMLSPAMSGGTMEFKSIKLVDDKCKIRKGNVFAE